MDMNIVKKLFIVCILSVLMMTMAACGSNSDNQYVGLWKGTVATMDDVEVNVSDVIGNYTIEIKDNGDAVMSSADKSQECSWEETEKGIKLEAGGEEMELASEEGKLVLEQSGIKVYFEKE